MRMSAVRSDFFLADNIVLSHPQENSQGWDRSDFCTKAKTKALIVSGSNKKSVPPGFTSLKCRVSYFSKAQSFWRV